MERHVQKTLEDAGDVAGALLWRRVCSDLGGPLRVGVVASDADAARRLMAELPESDRITWVPIHVAFEDENPVGLGSQDRLLSVHALVFVTPMTAALRTTERAALESLAAAGSPRLRAVTVVDANLLDHMSDDPEGQRQSVYDRMRELLSDDWPLLEGGAVPEWVASIDTPEATARRRAEVGPFLMVESADRLAETLGAAKAVLAEIDALLSEEDDALAAARKRGERVAAHTLAIIRRQTEQLDLDLREFLRELEGDLPAQVRDVDIETARRALPHWMTHVLESWLTDRLARWRRDVLDELEEIDIEEVVRAELLVPALQPAPVRGESRWGRRLGTTAAFGGAAALMALGMWIPGLVALAGGVIWSSFQTADTEEATRQKLLSTARLALSQMGDDAQRLLQDQLEHIREELDVLGEEGEASARSERVDVRTDLEARRARQLTEVRALETSHTILVQGLRTLGDS